MKAIILAGGMGSRLSEETVLKPKPMVEIGGRPILWHIMNIFGANGVDEFIIALGYKAEVIREYFLNFYALNNDISIDLRSGKTVIHGGNQPNWRIHLVDTGLRTQTGGRLGRLRRWLDEDETFMFTYGDGVADLDMRALLKFHQSHGKLATVTTVRSPERFGRIAFEGNKVVDFYEKPENSEGWINGGYFVLNAKVLDYVDDDETIWEREPIEALARDGQLMGYRHKGFWSCMDTLKEKNNLEELWQTGKAKWRIWDRCTMPKKRQAGDEVVTPLEMLG
ncbi:MAG TPA: glucose-1-phosphate cytidylyltransferase [Candidatus Binatia bacterium]|jgi:glucose-1-phosphate cytidylyltransferase|nr:glucose-1-phosphate cytidylyltransferase [Candidatus Binatia bacterium]